MGTRRLIVVLAILAVPFVGGYVTISLLPAECFSEATHRIGIQDTLAYAGIPGFAALYSLLCTIVLTTSGFVGIVKARRAGEAASSLWRRVAGTSVVLRMAGGIFLSISVFITVSLVLMFLRMIFRINWSSGGMRPEWLDACTFSSQWEANAFMASFLALLAFGGAFALSGTKALAGCRAPHTKELSWSPTLIAVGFGFAAAAFAGSILLNLLWPLLELIPHLDETWQPPDPKLVWAFGFQEVGAVQAFALLAACAVVTALILAAINRTRHARREDVAPSRSAARWLPSARHGIRAAGALILLLLVCDMTYAMTTQFSQMASSRTVPRLSDLMLGLGWFVVLRVLWSACAALHYGASGVLGALERSVPSAPALAPRKRSEAP